jgi:hypothetical protein
MERDFSDAVALVVDSLLSRREALVVGERQGSDLGLGLERPTAGEARFDLVPVSNVRLPKLPAEVDFTPLPDGGEIHEAGVEILQVAAAGADVFDQGLKVREQADVARRHQSSAAKHDLLARRDIGAANLQLSMNESEIVHPRAQEGEELVRFPYGEEALLHRLRV